MSRVALFKKLFDDRFLSLPLSLPVTQAGTRHAHTVCLAPHLQTVIQTKNVYDYD